MLFQKEKYIIEVNRGAGSVVTQPLRGLVENLIINPSDRYVLYDLKIYDEDQDEIFQEKDIFGRYQRNVSIPAGKSSFEPLVIMIANASNNIDFTVILIIREK